jgi:hypothetical protein
MRNIVVERHWLCVVYAASILDDVSDYGIKERGFWDAAMLHRPGTCVQAQLQVLHVAFGTHNRRRLQHVEALLAADMCCRRWDVGEDGF